MSTLKLNIDGKKKAFEIPEGWEAVTIEKYAKILRIDEAQNSVIKRMEIVSILLGLDLSIIELMAEEDFVKLENALDWFNTPMPNLPVEFVEIEGEKYYLYTDLDKLTMGEHISVDILTKKSNGNLMTVYDELLCLFLRKKKEDGNLETFKTDFMSRASIFGKVPIVNVNGLFLFFSNGANS